MNKKISFFLGLLSGLSLCGAGFFLLSKESSKLSESLFMAGYAQEVSTLAFILGESDTLKREKIAKSELCEAIGILEEKIEESSFNQNYFEVVTSKSIVEYQVQLTGLYGKYCAKRHLTM